MSIREPFLLFLVYGFFIELLRALLDNIFLIGEMIFGLKLFPGWYPVNVPPVFAG